VAWWQWSVSFSPPAVLEAAWPEFLKGAGIDANESELLRRIRSLQLLRMLALLAGDSLGPGVRRTVTERLHTSLRRSAPSPRIRTRSSPQSNADVKGRPELSWLSPSPRGPAAMSARSSWRPTTP
jgi:hypothetical protein